jgi:hypothetical protein
MNRTYVIMRPPGRDLEEALCLIRQEPRVRVINHAGSKALLINGPDNVVAALGQRLKGWTIALETKVGLPEPPPPRSSWKR